MRGLRSIAASALISPATAAAIRGWHELGRRLTGRRHRLVFYHRVADAWSWLLAQCLPELAASYDIELEIRIVAALPVDSAPDPERLDNYAAYDAMRLARAWSLEYPDGASPPLPTPSRLAERIILAQPRARALDILLEASAAAWACDMPRLAALARDRGALDESAADAMLATHLHDLTRRGHYLSGTLWYQGEWFWGLDRLALLEGRLARRHLLLRDHTVSANRFRPLTRANAGSPSTLDLEFYFSFRSPYSYLGAIQVTRLADRLGLHLQLCPVLPMVSRGLPVANRKLRYIVRDVARVAAQQGQPFGPLRDPLGRGVERCLAVFHHADSQGLGREFMLCAMRAIWTEAADLSRDAVLRRVGVKAGLSIATVDHAMESASWRARVEANAAALAVLGLWGVPGMCLRDARGRPLSVAWGQDRLWVIERAALGLDVAIPPPSLVQ